MQWSCNHLTFGCVVAVGYCEWTLLSYVLIESCGIFVDTFCTVHSFPMVHGDLTCVSYRERLILSFTVDLWLAMR